MYAVIETGGKQYKVTEGQRLRVEKLTGAVGDTLEIDKVYLYHDGENVVVGRPVVKDVTVRARIAEQDRAKKVLVFKMKRRKGYRRKAGHRQAFTSLVIEKIQAPGAAATEPEPEPSEE